MTSMAVNSLNVDLIQDQASISLWKQTSTATPGKSSHTAININVPIGTPGNQPERNLRRVAIEEAKKALREAIQALEGTSA